ncbi:unnamed protein product [Caenorhabditis bovis]|uniref:Uncharacterized protein n=1 Tax=Caenorhabditis bovis TaxID=2654633 RepID=A0A8S1FCZ1_9PELO|nr:unnamed protein product [Caenorhabditis bovis]
MDLSCEDFRRSVQEEIDYHIEEFREILRQGDEYVLTEELRPFIDEFVSVKERLDTLKAECLRGNCRHLRASFLIEKLDRIHVRACNVICIFLIERARAMGLIEQGFYPSRE